MNERAVSFQVAVPPGERVSLGEVPRNVRFILKDFLSGPAPVGAILVSENKLEVLVGDTSLAEIPPMLEHDQSGNLVYWFNTHFTSGILVRGPASVSLRQGGPERIRVTVGGIFEE
jgi:hypothetical protein